MKDYIKYSGDNLAAAASQLGRLTNTISDVEDMLSKVDTSDEWWSKLGLRTNYGDARESMQAARKSATAIHKKTENTVSGIRKTQEIFDQVERNIVLGGAGIDPSIYQTSGSDGAVPSVETGASVIGTDKKTTSKFWEFLMKAIGGTGGIGKIFEGIFGVALSNDWISLGKGITKIFQGIDKTASKWAETIKNSKEAKDTVENVGNATQAADAAISTKWSLDTALETFKKGIKKPMTWFFSAVISAYDTYKDIQNGRYASTDDYVVKWATRTISDVVIKTGVNAVLKTAVTAGLTAAGIAVGGWVVPVVVGVATVVTVCAGDSLVKWASKGEYSGMTDAISDCAVKAWDNVKQNVTTEWEMITTFWKAPISNFVPGY